MDKINVVYITDAKYAMPTCVSITSLKENKKENTDVSIYVIVNKVPVEDIENIKQMSADRVHIHVIELDNSIYEKIMMNDSLKSHVSPMAFIKFDLPEIFSELDKVLYLDGDVIVQKDLAELYRVDIEGLYMAAVKDMWNVKRKSLMATRIGMESGEYVNTGVMLLNLKKMREDRIGKSLLVYRLTRKNHYMDQDAYNYVLERKRKILPYDYNFLSTIVNGMSNNSGMAFDDINKDFFKGIFQNLDECIKSQRIIHLTSNMKPWDFKTPIFTDIFSEYYTKSAYGKRTLELKSLDLLIDSKQKEDVAKTNAVQNPSNSLYKKYRFPFEAVKAGSRIVIYGGGTVGRIFLQQVANSAYCIVVAVCDKQPANARVVETPVISIPVLSGMDSSEYDVVLVAIKDSKIAKTVREELILSGIPSSKIRWIDPIAE